MKTKLFAIAFMFVLISTPVYAERLVVDDLTEEQAAELRLLAAKAKNVTPTVSPSKVDEWVSVGKNLGLALTAVAGELGVAADKFLDSSTGKITVFLIIWKMVGSDLMGAVFGTLFFICWFPVWIYFFRRMCVIKSIKVEVPEKGFKSIKYIQYYDLHDPELKSVERGSLAGTRFTMAIVLVVLIVLTNIIIF